MAMAESIIVGEVAVAITADGEGFDDSARAQLVPSAAKIGDEWGQRFSSAATSVIADMMAKWSDTQTATTAEAGGKLGEEYGAEFRKSAESELGEGIKTQVDLSTAEATDDVDKLRVETTDKPLEVPVMATTADAKLDIDKLRTEEASKPIVMKVVTTTEGGGAAASAGESAGESDAAMALAGAGGATAVKDAEEEGDKAGAGFGSRFTGRLKSLFNSDGASGIGGAFSGIGGKAAKAGEDAGHEMGGAFSSALSTVSKFGMPAAIAGAAVAVTAVLGEKLDIAQKQLQASMKTAGLSWSQYSGKIADTGKSMAKYGYTQDQVDTSINSVVKVTGSATDAMKAQGAIADIAATQHISLSQAATQYTRALAGNARTLKQLGIVQASGATEQAAYQKGATTLADQIHIAGGMSQFAALHNMSLAQAQKTVSAAMGDSSGLVEQLTNKGVGLSTVMKDVAAATSGNPKSAATGLAALQAAGLTAAQAQQLVTQTAHGSAAAYAKLGIEVLPKAANAAENFSAVTSVITGKLGGQASAVADTFGGKMRALRATLEDAGQSIGMKLLPPLEKFADMLVRYIPDLLKFGSDIGKLVMPVVLIFFTGLKTIFTLLFSGPMKYVTLAAIGMAAGFFLLLPAIEAVTMALLANPFIAIAIAIVLVIGLVVKFRTQIVNTLINAWKTVQHGITVAWDFVVEMFKKYWMLIIGVFLGPIALIVGLIIKFHGDILHWIEDLMKLVKNAWSAGWNWVKNEAETIWNGIKTEAADFVRGIERIWDGFWGTVKSVSSAAFSWMSGAFGKFWGWMKTGWQDAVSGFKTIWDTIKSAAEAPVKFVVNTVYNKGIVPVVDAIAGIIGKHPLKAVSGFAAGGVVPGHSPTDNYHGISVRGGEGILVPEAVEAIGGPGAIYALNARHGYQSHGGWGGFASGGVPGAARGGQNVGGSGATKYQAPVASSGGGGWWGDVTGAVGDVGHAIASGVSDVVSSVMHTLRGLAGDALGAAINGIVNPLLNKIPGINTPIGQMIKGDIVGMENSLVGWVEGKTGQSSSGYAGVGSGNISNDIKSILKTLGLPASLLGTWMKQVQTESGGNAKAVNNWDVNAKKGTPSVGLVQVIAPTFDSFAGPYKNTGPFLHGVSINPMANLYAGINYAKSAYGSSMASAIGQGHGYASGTSGAKPGWAWVGELGPELAYFHGGEKIYSHEQSMAALKSMPNVNGYYTGTSPGMSVDDIETSGAQSLQAAVVGIERRLDMLNATTKGVGSTIGNAINSSTRQSGNSSSFNTRGY